jgi:hypothetical protein
LMERLRRLEAIIQLYPTPLPLLRLPRVTPRRLSSCSCCQTPRPLISPRRVLIPATTQFGTAAPQHASTGAGPQQLSELGH